MTEPMRLLYDYTLETLFVNTLNTKEYREVSELVSRLEQRLRRQLPTDCGETAERLWDALAEQRLLELEAMFTSAMALPRLMG